jgi:steroid delta-isomerase-like uncharacterized protein
MNVEECKELVESYHAATNRGDLDALDKIFAKDFINEAAGFDPVRGCEDMKILIRELLEAFPDWHVSVDDMFGEGNKVVVRWRFTGTHKNDYKDIPATNLKVHAAGIHIDHIENGKIAKRWACNNFGDLFSTLRAHAKS